MSVSRRLLLGGAAALSAAPIVRARAQAKSTISVGVLTDLSGTYRDNTGPTSVGVLAVQASCRVQQDRRTASSR